jgi:hypothetical protein
MDHRIASLAGNLGLDCGFRAVVSFLLFTVRTVQIRVSLVSDKSIFLNFWFNSFFLPYLVLAFVLLF